MKYDSILSIAEKLGESKTIHATLESANSMMTDGEVTLFVLGEVMLTIDLATGDWTMRGKGTSLSR